MHPVYSLGCSISGMLSILSSPSRLIGYMATGHVSPPPPFFNILSGTVTVLYGCGQFSFDIITQRSWMMDF